METIDKSFDRLSQTVLRMRADLTEAERQRDEALEALRDIEALCASEDGMHCESTVDCIHGKVRAILYPSR